VRIDAGYEALIPWVERTVGGRVVACERQGDRRSGGRPAFFIDVAGATGTQRFYARMRRGDGMQSPHFTLAREHAVLEEVTAAGIAAPRPYGHCEDPEGILLERLEGQDDYSTIEDEAQRDAIDRAFVGEIAKLHALDAERFEKRGIACPRTPEEFALGDLAHWEAGFDRSVRRPVPLVTFCRQWLHRNVPAAPERAVLVQGDTGPGQFLFEGDRLTGIVDWEFAHLADPMVDLGYIRGRDFYNPGADMRKWMALYAERAGPIDWLRLRYYTVKALLITPLALAGVVQRMRPSMDHAEWYAQDVNYRRATIEAVAEAIGLTLEPPELPDPEPTEHDVLLAMLESNLRDEHAASEPDGHRRHRLNLAARLATFARNAMRRGPALREMELDEMGALLGRRPADPTEGHAAVDRLVQREGPRREETLVRYLHRQVVREEALMAGAMGAGEGARLQPIG
jgi:aminoglycoside phosphotransferase (APT) family kinase protein